MEYLKSDELRALAAQLPEVVIKAKAKNAHRKYDYGFKKWVKWCRNYQEVCSLPADGVYVALYLLSVMQNSSTPSTVETAYYSISWAHKLSDLPDPCNSQLPKLVLESSKRILAHKTQKKEVVNSSMILKLVEMFGGASANLMDLRDINIIVLSYAGFLRFSEVSNLKSSHIKFEEGYVSIFIERSKTDVYRDGSWVLVAKTGSIACPYSLLQRYLKAAKLGDTSEDQYIFRSVNYRRKTNTYCLRESSYGPISYTRAREVVLGIFKAIGLNEKLFGLHSLRAGGATAAANNGVPDRLFKRHGRWKSELAKDGYVKDKLKERLQVSLKLGL